MRRLFVADVIMPWPGLVIFAFLVSGFIGLQVIIEQVIASSKTVASNVTCEVQSVDIGEKPVVWGLGSTVASMKVICGGKEYEVQTPSLIISYLYKKKPLSCSIDGAGGATCKVQE